MKYKILMIPCFALLTAQFVPLFYLAQSFTTLGFSFPSRDKMVKTIFYKSSMPSTLKKTIILPVHNRNLPKADLLM
jgi:hypothetical protein